MYYIRNNKSEISLNLHKWRIGRWGNSLFVIKEISNFSSNYVNGGRGRKFSMFVIRKIKEFRSNLH